VRHRVHRLHVRGRHRQVTDTVVLRLTRPYRRRSKLQEPTPAAISTDWSGFSRTWFSRCCCHARTWLRPLHSTRRPPLSLGSSALAPGRGLLPGPPACGRAACGIVALLSWCCWVPCAADGLGELGISAIDIPFMRSVKPSSRPLPRVRKRWSTSKRLCEQARARACAEPMA